VRRPQGTSPQLPVPVARPLTVPRCCALPGPDPAPLVRASPMVGGALTPKHKATSQTGLTIKEREFVRALARVQIRALLGAQRSREGEQR
jgi:hypothetical protein